MRAVGGLLRAGAKLTFHTPRVLKGVDYGRAKRVPLFPGADWRDLRNEEITEGGVVYPAMVYVGRDEEAAERMGMTLNRAVCRCQTGTTKAARRDLEKGKGGEARVCPQYEGAFAIPWSLPHTAFRHNHWKYLYGEGGVGGWGSVGGVATLV